MQITGENLTTPVTIDQKVASFCRQLSSEQPIFLGVLPELWCRQSTCEMNVEKYIEQHGGEKKFGYKVWYMKSKYIEAERHVVHSKDGQLKDITFNSDGEKTILFVPALGHTSGFDERPIKVRKGFTQRARLKIKELNERDRQVQRMSNQESWDRMLTYEEWLSGKRMSNVWLQGGS